MESAQQSQVVDVTSKAAEKVIEFMKHFEYTLSTFPNTKESENFKTFASILLNKEIERVQNGENKEVEKRYKYFVDYM